ncbi:hypothetical protein SGL43_02263 [Streptomyces globisporus]|uniref:Uncharacterized protein n=1 Tax=Streptomyces globisporus TaxID=1908 RepID=A0ABM9GVR9_STRGL|nr:hypothetical protein SGL43_02263 [Streptomyces globisporus]
MTLGRRPRRGDPPRAVNSPWPLWHAAPPKARFCRPGESRHQQTIELPP